MRPHLVVGSNLSLASGAKSPHSFLEFLETRRKGSRKVDGGLGKQKS